MYTRLRSASVVTASASVRFTPALTIEREDAAEPLDQRVLDGLAEHRDLEQERVACVLAPVGAGDQPTENTSATNPWRSPTTSYRGSR